MPFRINWKHPLNCEIRGLAADKLRSAADALSDQSGGIDSAVHSARKAIKHVRALYRLVGAGDRRFLAQENEQLRGIAAGLAPLRDRAALIEAMDRLLAKTAAPVLSEFRQQLAKDSATPAPGADAALEHACFGLRAAMGRLDRLDLPENRRKTALCLAEGWRKTSRRALAAKALSQTAATDDAFHALRKRGQDRWMQAMLMRTLWPAGFKALQQQAQHMVAMLGAHRDLGLLEMRLDIEAGDGARSMLRDIVDEERRRLAADALALAGEVFDAATKKEADIIRLLIRNAG